MSFEVILRNYVEHQVQLIMILLKDFFFSDFEKLLST